VRRKPKRVEDVRLAVGLHVLGEYSTRKAAQAANEKIKACERDVWASVTKDDVLRFSPPYFKMIAEDRPLEDLRKDLERVRAANSERRARPLSSDDVASLDGRAEAEDSYVKLKVAEALVDARVEWVSNIVRVAISELELQQKGNPNLVLRRVYTDGEESCIAGFFEFMSLAGFPIGIGDARDVLTTLALELGVDEEFVASRRYLEGLQKRTGSRIGPRKASAIDPLRARAADPKVADAQFERGEAFYQVLKAADPARWPWATLADMPSNRVYNLDEEGSDANKRRSKVLAAKSLQDGSLHRVFEVTHGDHDPFHVSVVVIIRADGVLLPFVIIHSCPGTEDPVLSHAEAEHIYKRQPDGSYLSPEGFTVLISTNGSMTKDLFPFLVDHFLNHVEDDGLGVWLNFDGHASRWNAPALYKLAGGCLPMIIIMMA
jgi:hypothetical protein